MARRYRRKKYRLKPKKQTVYSILTLLIIGGSFLIILSFFNSGKLLDPVKNLTEYYFGWAKVFLPIVLITLSFILIKIKTTLTRPQVSLGTLLIYLCIISLTRSGLIGDYIWYTFANSMSDFGAFILISAMFMIGLIVLFNTSLDEILKFVISSYKYFDKFSSSVFKKQKAPFIEKLPVKPPLDFKKEMTRQTLKSSIPAKETAGVTSSGLSAGIIPTISTTNEIWEYPPLSLLSTTSGQKADRGDMKQNADIIEKTLESFGITAKVVEVNLGPAVTQYALEIALGTKLSKITALSNDLALALAAPTGQIRIEAPIPGRRLLGIEIPNRSLEFVTLRHMLSQDIMQKSKEKLSVALGLDVSGDPITANIAKMPHVLIAGTTGSGKSVLINSWIASLLFRTNPSEIKLILVDPKRVELTLYKGIPHLMTDVIVEPDQILSALRWAIGEMNRRYKLFSEVGVRNIDGYHEMSGIQSLPYIAIFVDELADLMSYAPVEVEDSICRLAQMARATGIHLVVATQRPSVDVITGLIKANIPCRIAFNVSSMVDSRVIIDMPGAEKLLGRGDMLYIPPDQAKPTRIQGTFVAEAEVTRLVDFLKSKKFPVQYTKEVTSITPTWKKGPGGKGDDGRDELFDEAVKVVCQYDRASASLLQRRLSIGYARAARIIDQLEEEGIIGAGEGSKPRDVLMKNPDEYFANRQTAETAA